MLTLPVSILGNEHMGTVCFRPRNKYLDMRTVFPLFHKLSQSSRPVPAYCLKLALVKTSSRLFNARSLVFGLPPLSALRSLTTTFSLRGIGGSFAHVQAM